jgi:hypothetical protein
VELPEKKKLADIFVKGQGSGSASRHRLRLRVPLQILSADGAQALAALRDAGEMRNLSLKTGAKAAEAVEMKKPPRRSPRPSKRALSPPNR